jgi:two-component system cell cycle sensor histidine kinase PleC
VQSKLIADLLDVSRIVSGKLRLDMQAVDLRHVVDSAMEAIAPAAEARGVHLAETSAPGPCPVQGDPARLQQIVGNLLSNAVKFTPSGGRITLRVGWTAGGGQYISVKDNGPGIPEEEIPVVLSAFGQGSIAIKSAEQGTGLGLPIVQGLLAMHGGEFELHSKLREGTEAIAIFPFSRVMEELPALPTKAVAARRR